jgi:hypothetical protein
MRWGLALLVALGCGIGHAEPRHLVYAEGLGKAGPYGLGYEYSVLPRLAVGAAASYAVMRDQQLSTFAPYVHATVLRGKRNRMFGELGAIVAHSKIPSPVSDWNGMTSTGAGAFGSLGWEHASDHFVLRTALLGVAGEGGTALTVGFLVGWRP